MNFKRLSFITVLLYGITLHALAQEPLLANHASEGRIKAAYLFNFARFVTWPDTAFEDKASPIVICILGKGPIHEALHTITGKRVGNRPLMIRRILTLDELSPCHLLYVEEIGSPPIHRILAKLKDQPILTISSQPYFSLDGGMITFILVKHNIHFEINLNATQRTGLFISSRLLKLARLMPNP